MTRRHRPERNALRDLYRQPSPAARLPTDLVKMAYEHGLTPAQFAELARRMDGDKAKILTVLKGL